jgi:fluoride exporter
MLKALALVMLGGAGGAAARYLITHFSSELSQHHGFPYGTLGVNAIGSMLVGYVLAAPHHPSHDSWRLLAATGFCGGFTTFSAFAWESVAYLQAGSLLPFLGNLALNNVLAFAGLFAGIKLQQSI